MEIKKEGTKKINLPLIGILLLVFLVLIITEDTPTEIQVAEEETPKALIFNADKTEKTKFTITGKSQDENKYQRRLQVSPLPQSSSPNSVKSDIDNNKKQERHSEGNQVVGESSTPILSAASTPPIDEPMMQGDYNGTNSFGACLYWMDDYERLIEWIAYHWQVLPDLP